ncbi:hypothetical protein MVES1_003648 [Malassezia vespertilionis]|uniref:uncharacterized protein n=1 Tax=Malassezia vespertilionis TaxID=2020962 RepID=UPI0024B10A6D|nr:uncharacterized protein MVES1_003648 [Malassezia vespertilionis]WFD08276.1 hypothetical protein MVES1_003648 [Malassezia vespertilionis]
MQSDVPLVKRLHISGLTPSFSRVSLREKLSQYGEVMELEGCSDAYLDGVGNRRPYAFATMRATPVQLARCMNSLSGAIWKGAKLRIGEAKPRFDERLKKEREKVAAVSAQRLEKEAERRRLRYMRRPWMAIQAPQQTPVTREDIDAGAWGWKVTPAGHLVRPVHLRPSRPIARPNAAEGSRRRRATTRIVRRAARVTIDPTRYKNEHVDARMLDAMGGEEAAWRWVLEDGLWRAYDEKGQCKAEEPVPASSDRHNTLAWHWSPAIEEIDSDQHEDQDVLYVQPEETEELFATSGTNTTWWDDDEASREDLTDTNVATPKTQDKVPGASEPLDETHDVTAGAQRAKPACEDILDASDFSDGYDETQDATPAPHDEKHRAMKLLEHLFGDEEGGEKTVPSAALEQDTVQELDTPGKTSTILDVATKEATVQLDSLTDMFQPAAQGTYHNMPTTDTGFVLLGDLEGEELDEDVFGEPHAPIAPPVYIPTTETIRLPDMASPHTLASPHHLMLALQRADAAPFWRVHTEEEIDAHWRLHRGDLTQAYKRIHRESLKKNKRRVVGSRRSASIGGRALTKHST